MVCAAHPTADQNLAHKVGPGPLALARVSSPPPLLKSRTPPPELKNKAKPHVERGGAPARHLRDRAGPQRAADRTAAALRALHAPLVDTMHVLRPRALPHMVRRRARLHARLLRRARGRHRIRSPRTFRVPPFNTARRLFFCCFFGVVVFVSPRTGAVRQRPRPACVSLGYWAPP